MTAELLKIGWLLAAALGCGLLYRGWCGWLSLRREQLADASTRKAIDDLYFRQASDVTALRLELSSLGDGLRAETAAHVAKLEAADKGLFDRNESQVKNLMLEVHEVVAAFETKQATALTSLAGGERGRMRFPGGQRTG